MQTLLLYENYIYNLAWNGRLSCYDAESGEKFYDEKLGKSKSFTASPVASDGRIYAVGDDGSVYVVKSGAVFEIISENKLNDVCMVSPSITEGTIFFRTQSRLIAVSGR